MSCCSRRDFLKTMAAAGVAAACAGCGGPSLPSEDISAGNVSDLSVGSLRAVSGESVILGRDSGGVYAMSALCTHSSCDMTQQGQITSSGAFCACHGSQFDADGNVVRGPARQPLPHLAVSIDATGAITIHPQQVVAETVRVSA